MTHQLWRRAKGSATSRHHPDCDVLLAESYTEEQRKEIKQSDWDERRKLRAAQ